MANPPPVPAASNPVPPPTTKIQIVNLQTGLATIPFISFLTQLWAQMNGDGSLSDAVQSLTAQFAILVNSVAALTAQVAVIFGMHGDGTLASDGTLTVTSTEGVPFAPSATTDTTIADNVEWGTLPTLQLPIWLFQWATLDDLPEPEAGNGVLCSDLGGGPGALLADGAAWRRTSPGMEFAPVTANLSLQVLTNAEEQIQDGVLAASINVTLTNDANCYPGARFRWLRQTAGPGPYVVNFKEGLSAAVLYTSADTVLETIEFVYNGLAWTLAQHSTL